MSTRNYKAMGDEKLRRVAAEGVPSEDVDAVNALLRDRGMNCGPAAVVYGSPSVSVAAYKPMLCHEAPKGGDGLPSLPTGPGWVMEPKLDGWRFMFHVKERGVEAFGGRNGNSYNGQAGAIEAELLESLPAGTVIDCELVSSDPKVAVSTALARQPNLLRALAFDLLRVNGADTRSLPWEKRRELLEAAKLDGLVGIVPVAECDQELYEKWLAMGLEGAVVKRVGSRYHSGKRSRDWLKLKPQGTAEAVIVGYEMGKGESNGHVIGALRFHMLTDAGEGVESSCGVKDDAQAHELTAQLAGLRFSEQPEFIGRVIELRHHGIFPSGAPRHPVFHRWRPDREK